jgi:hypothetical protein
VPPSPTSHAHSSEVAITQCPTLLLLRLSLAASSVAAGRHCHRRMRVCLLECKRTTWAPHPPSSQPPRTSALFSPSQVSAQGRFFLPLPPPTTSSGDSPHLFPTLTKAATQCAPPSVCLLTASPPQKPTKPVEFGVFPISAINSAI